MNLLFKWQLGDVGFLGPQNAVFTHTNDGAKTFNIDLNAYRFIFIAIWNGMYDYYSPILLPMGRFGNGDKIHIMFGDSSGIVERVDETTISLVASGGYYTSVQFFV